MMIAWLTSALLASAPPACSSPPGTEVLLEQPQRILVLGDNHGTVEIPAAFLGIVCEAAQQGPVTVGLEMAETERPLIDRAMAAPDETAARDMLLYGDFGHSRSIDGRNSEAMLDMMVGFWRLKAAGYDLTIHPFMPVLSTIQERPQAWWELEMAYGMSRALANRPQARVLIFVGDLHARKAALPSRPDIGLPAAGHLHAADTLSLQIAQQGGTSWGCRPECGLQTSGGAYDVEVRGITISPVEDGAYDGVWAVGPTTASPPSALSAKPT